MIDRILPTAHARKRIRQRYGFMLDERFDEASVAAILYHTADVVRPFSVDGVTTLRASDGTLLFVRYGYRGRAWLISIYTRNLPPSPAMLDKLIRRYGNAR